MINQFKGNYFYLSNFYEAPVNYDGIVYQNNEAAFQAQKTLDLETREKFRLLDPKSAKSLGRRIKLRDDWEQVKDQIMYDICLAKFTQNPDLGRQLVSTTIHYLEEANTWGDKYWGTVNGVGKNHLGLILMRVREQIRRHKLSQPAIEFTKEEYLK